MSRLGLQGPKRTSAGSRSKAFRAFVLGPSPGPELSFVFRGLGEQALSKQKFQKEAFSRTVTTAAAKTTTTVTRKPIKGDLERHFQSEIIHRDRYAVVVVVVVVYLSKLLLFAVATRMKRPRATIQGGSYQSTIIGKKFIA